MTALPAVTEFTDNDMAAIRFSDAVAAMRDFLAGILGTDGTQAGALAALHTPLARYEARSGTGSVAAADRGKWLACTGSWTLSLLAAATAGAGFAVIVANAGSGTITVDPADAETIDGAATATIEAGRAAVLMSTGASWVSAVLPGVGGGPILAPAAGTAAAPAFAFSGDADTGIYRLSADQMGLATGGTQRALMTTSVFQINLPVTGTAVAQTQTDTTAGRLLTTGRFGLGCDGSATTTPFIADIDSASTATGFYAVQTSTPGTRPTGATNYAVLIVARQALTGFAQVWFNSNGTGQYFRTAVSGTWSAWAPFYSHNNILGTVSQSGGVPTGAVIERGSNANGEYVRFADGTQICQQVVTLNPCNTALGAMFQSTPAVVWTFPVAFAVGSNPSVSASDTNIGGGFLVVPYTASHESCSLGALRPTANGGSPIVRACATGRWY